MYRPWAQKIVFWGVGVALSAVSCASPQKTELQRLQWPDPPLEPRVEFVRLLSSESDLGRKPTLGERFKTFLTGEEPPNWRLSQPMDVAVSDDGKRIYVSDFGQSRVFLFDLESRRVVLRGPFDRPFGVALDSEENLYVVEQGGAGIQVIDRAGEEVRRISHPSLVRPTDIVVDRDRSLIFVADPARKSAPDHTVKVFTLEGEYLREIGKGKGEGPGQLYFPTYLALDHQGSLYVSSTMNARIDVFSAEGVFIKSVGGRGNAFGMFDKPKGVGVDPAGNIYVVDSGWSNVQIFDPAGRILLFFGGRGGYPGLLKNPTGISMDSNHRIYVADLLNGRVGIYKLSEP